MSPLSPGQPVSSAGSSRSRSTASWPRAAAALARYVGHVDHLGADGVVAFFGVPHSHEDDAERALHVAFGLLAAAQRAGIVLAAGIKIGPALVAWQEQQGRAETGEAEIGEAGARRRCSAPCWGRRPNCSARRQGARSWSIAQPISRPAAAAPFAAWKCAFGARRRRPASTWRCPSCRCARRAAFQGCRRGSSAAPPNWPLWSTQSTGWRRGRAGAAAQRRGRHRQVAPRGRGPRPAAASTPFGWRGAAWR